MTFVDSDITGRSAQIQITKGRVVRLDGLSADIVTDDDVEHRGCVVLVTGERHVLELEIGDQVLIWRPSSEGDNPVILGRVCPIGRRTPDEFGMPDHVVLEAKTNLTLKCGDGSITIRRDGKILIKGKDLVSHATRANRIRGGSVTIN